MPGESGQDRFPSLRRADARIRELRIINVVVMLLLAVGVAAALLTNRTFSWFTAGANVRIIQFVAVLALVSLFVLYVRGGYRQVNAMRDAALKSEVTREGMLQRADDLKFVLQAAARIDPERSPEESLPELLGDLVSLLHAQHGTLFLPAPGPKAARTVKRFAEFSASPAGAMECMAVELQQVLAQTVAETGEPKVIPAEHNQGLGVLAHPLQIDGRSRGAIVLCGSTEKSMPSFSEHHIELLALFSQHGALTFGYGRRIARLRQEHESLRQSYQSLMQERGLIVGSARASAAARTVSLLRERIAEPVQLASAQIDRLGGRALPEEVEDGLKSVRAYLEDILNATSSADELTLGKGNEPVDEMVQAAVALRSYPCRQAIIDVDLSLHASGIQLDGRAAALRQCLEEVLDHSIRNVMQISPPRKLTLETCTTGTRVRIAVHDNGPDIDLGRVPDLLAERAQHRATSDTRVGLFAAADLLRRAGGDMSVKPNPSGGTTYILEAPHARSGATGTEAKSPPVHKREPEASSSELGPA